MKKSKKNGFYINILSLDRSRSTITNIELAMRTSSIALGEVSRVISPIGNEKFFFQKNNNCSCEQNIENCFFWSKILTKPNSEFEFLKVVQNSDFSFVESSKTIKHSKLLRSSLTNKNLIVILLLRDFKSWRESIISAQKRSNEGSYRNVFKDYIFLKSNIRLFLRRFYIFSLFEFLVTNIRLIIEAKKYKKSYLVTSSNELNGINLRGRLFENHALRGNRVLVNAREYSDWNSNNSFAVKLLKLLWNIF